MARRCCSLRIICVRTIISPSHYTPILHMLTVAVCRSPPTRARHGPRAGSRSAWTSVEEPSWQRCRSLAWSGPSHAERCLNPVWAESFGDGPGDRPACRAVYCTTCPGMSRCRHPQRRSPPLRCCHVGAAEQDSAKGVPKKKFAEHLTGLALLVTAPCRTFRPLRPFEHPPKPRRPAAPRQRRPAPFQVPVRDSQKPVISQP